MNFSLVSDSLPLLFQGLLMTLLLSVASMIGSTIVGRVAATWRTARLPVGSQIARIYIESFRGSPLLITLLVVYYGVAYAGSVSYTHLRAHETRHDLVCRLLLEK